MERKDVRQRKMQHGRYGVDLTHARDMCAAACAASDDPKSFRLEHQHPQHHAEDQYDQEQRQENKEKCLGYPARARRDVGESQGPGDHRDDEKEYGQLEHRVRLLTQPNKTTNTKNDDRFEASRVYSMRLDRDEGRMTKMQLPT